MGQNELQWLATDAKRGLWAPLPAHEGVVSDAPDPPRKCLVKFQD